MNKRNIVAALLAAQAVGCNHAKALRAVTSFRPLANRLEFVAEIGGVSYYNDSLATTPQATIAALEALGGSVMTLITGGLDRGLSYDELAQAIRGSNIKTLILFPDTGSKILASLGSKAGSMRTAFVDNMQEAVALARKYTQMGQTCLLSPAAASFNLFKDYQDRGDQFKQYVLAAKEKK